MERLIQLLYPVLPDTLKEILFPLSNALLEINKLNIELFYWGEKEPEKFMTEEQEQRLKQLLTKIGQYIIKLIEYRDKTKAG